jgi:ankyrin repeat protein
MSDALQALYAGDLERAQSLLARDDELSVFDAAAFGRVERLRTLLREDPSRARAFSEDGFTPLHLAVFAQQEEAARALIEHGADTDVRSTGEIARVPPLGTAAFVGSVAMARLLLDAGADVNGQGEGGFTALHSAALHGNEELARLLLERGADPTVVSGDGRTPAELARDERVRRLLPE